MSLSRAKAGETPSWPFPKLAVDRLESVVCDLKEAVSLGSTLRQVWSAHVFSGLVVSVPAAAVSDNKSS